jgi:hypothetical protein
MNSNKKGRDLLAHFFVSTLDLDILSFEHLLPIEVWQT